MYTAKLVSRIPTHAGLDQALYRCDPPLEGHQYVVASAADIPGQAFRIYETYLFPANELGDITDWGELTGSMKDTLSHEEAFASAGYLIVAGDHK